MFYWKPAFTDSHNPLNPFNLFYLFGYNVHVWYINMLHLITWQRLTFRLSGRKYIQFKHFSISDQYYINQYKLSKSEIQLNRQNHIYRLKWQAVSVKISLIVPWLPVGVEISLIVYVIGRSVCTTIVQDLKGFWRVLHGGNSLFEWAFDHLYGWNRIVIDLL